MFLSLVLGFGKSLITSELASYLVQNGITKAELWTTEHQQAFLASLKAKFPWLVTAQVETAVVAIEEAAFSMVAAAIKYVGGAQAAQNKVNDAINHVLSAVSDAHAAASGTAKAS